MKKAKHNLQLSSGENFNTAFSIGQVNGMGQLPQESL